MPILPEPQPMALSLRMRTIAQKLRENDNAPKTRDECSTRRVALRENMFKAMGTLPDKPCDLKPTIVGTLQRPGYRIDKVIFQSQPDVWVSGSLYVPAGAAREKRPAVLGVHGHWRGARRDPVVQSRCLGLVQLGFVVLMIDAFGSGERYTEPALGTYHGALYGSTLWPAGHTLLGLQVYDNRRAVDFLQSLPEVDGTKIGITGASGGGNQSMYAGALDERIGCVVPVCSVGNYQAYLQAACCVCEMLPGALSFTEEGDVLGLVAPRALMVINATRDGFQFSVGQAKISLARAQAIFDLHGVSDKVRHTIFESPHDYGQSMREAMYGWMTLWLKNEGKGEPIREPKIEVEKPEDLACFPDNKKPAGFLYPPSFAYRSATALVERANATKPDHVEAWEATAVAKRGLLRRQILGDMPAPPRDAVKVVSAETLGGWRTTQAMATPEINMPVPFIVKHRAVREGAVHPVCLFLSFEGKDAALRHPLVGEWLEQNFTVAALDLRGTGETQPARDEVRGAPDHTTSEHALWVGRPLLGQYICDVQSVLDWFARQQDVDRRRIALVGLGQAGLVALTAAAMLEDNVAAVATVRCPASWLTREAYPEGTRMGLLAPKLFEVGDVPHLAAINAPRKVNVIQAVDLANRKLDAKVVQEAFGFPREIYRLYKAADRLRIADDVAARDVF